MEDSFEFSVFVLLGSFSPSFVGSQSPLRTKRFAAEASNLGARALSEICLARSRAVLILCNSLGKPFNFGSTPLVFMNPEKNLTMIF